MHPIESSILWGNFGGNIETLKSVEYVLISIPACYLIPAADDTEYYLYVI